MIPFFQISNPFQNILPRVIPQREVIPLLLGLDDLTSLARDPTRNPPPHKTLLTDHVVIFRPYCVNVRSLGPTRNVQVVQEGRWRGRGQKTGVETVDLVAGGIELLGDAVTCGEAEVGAC